LSPYLDLIGPGISSIVNADIGKARELLGYEPEWSFERGIEAAIEWYKGEFVEGF
jgi:nucleoside-diphosphate-sugar epimerase